MLAFACAGLDSMIKQVVRDALESVIDSSDGLTGTSGCTWRSACEARHP